MLAVCRYVHGTVPKLQKAGCKNLFGERTMIQKVLIKTAHEMGLNYEDEFLTEAGIELTDADALLKGIDHIMAILNSISENLKHDPTMAKWFIEYSERPD